MNTLTDSAAELRALLGEGGNPHAGPGTTQSDPALDKKVLDQTTKLMGICKNAQREFALLFNETQPYHAKNPQHEKLHELLMVIQEAYKILGELHSAASQNRGG